MSEAGSSDTPKRKLSSLQSSSSLGRGSSTVRSTAPPSAIRTVVTEPPWAKDEPRTSTDSIQIFPATPTGGSRPASRSDILSLASSSRLQADREHRWFPFTRKSTFNLPRPTLSPISPGSSSLAPQSSSATVLPPLAESDRTPAAPPAPHSHTRFRNWGLHVTLPQPTAPNTLAQSRTPGWESPWVPRVSGPLGGALSRPEISEKGQDLSRWRRFKKRARRYLLNNVYVPLLFRFINITLTTAALALAAQLRLIERKETKTGSLGPSPTIVVIFAPLTLAHVMFAIYLEYFGRPLGLWRTSAKLAHTLVEVIFICLWSGAFALCLNDFFTYFKPCSTLALLSNDPTQISDGDEVPCNHQLALICLVAVGLMMYCFNLVISLFRIFEKVKVHNHTLKTASSARLLS